VPLTAVLSGIFCDLDEDGMPVSRPFCDLEGVCFSAPVVRMLLAGRRPSEQAVPVRRSQAGSKTHPRAAARIEKAPHAALSGAFLIHAEP